MIDKTNRHFRYFLRLLSRRAVLYTEMITSAAIVRGNRGKLLDFDSREQPLVLQLAGDDPEELAEAVRVADEWGYEEFNLNVGCPSERVQKGNFGACLMADPGLVARIVSAMSKATAKPVTVKHRVGIEGFGVSKQSYEELREFVRTVSDAGCARFIVHARIAILEGLSPKENRSIPPLRYEDVWRLKADNPGVKIEINGHIRSLEQAREHFAHGVDGVMFGRVSYEDPRVVAAIDADGEAPSFDFLREAAIRYAAYLDTWPALNPRAMIWPLLELFPGMRGSRKYRQILSAAYRQGQNVSELVAAALDALSPTPELVTL